MPALFSPEAPESVRPARRERQSDWHRLEGPATRTSPSRHDNVASASELRAAPRERRHIPPPEEQPHRTPTEAAARRPLDRAGPRGRGRRRRRRNRADRGGRRPRDDERRPRPRPAHPGGRHATRSMGGFGSAVSYTGIGHRYIATPDRGPADGTTSYRDRYYLIDIAVTPGAPTPVAVFLVRATPLSNEDGGAFTGSTAAFDGTAHRPASASIPRASGSARPAPSSSPTSTAPTCTSSMPPAGACARCRCRRSS